MSWLLGGFDQKWASIILVQIPTNAKNIVDLLPPPQELPKVLDCQTCCMYSGCSICPHTTRVWLKLFQMCSNPSIASIISKNYFLNLILLSAAYLHTSAIMKNVPEDKEIWNWSVSGRRIPHLLLEQLYIITIWVAKFSWDKHTYLIQEKADPPQTKISRMRCTLKQISRWQLIPKNQPETCKGYQVSLAQGAFFDRLHEQGSQWYSCRSFA